LTEPCDPDKITVWPYAGLARFHRGLGTSDGIQLTMYAVFRTSGKQFRAEPGLRLKLPSIAAEAGETITFSDVLLVSDGEAVKVGVPTVEGAAVTAEVLRHGRADKIIVFKRKRRKQYRKKQGHRQGFTEVRVAEIVA
jgi:large subunit ribosomal protein L21